jgi:hypothetical protein
MRYRAVPALLAVLLLAGCTITRGSGQVSSESRQVSGFSKVELSGSGELKIEQTGTESLTISAEANVLPKIGSEVSGGTLMLGAKSNTKIIPTKPISYSLTVKDLTGLLCPGPAASPCQSWRLPD